MKPIIRTYLDTARSWNVAAPERGEAMRRALALAEGDVQTLVESFKYVANSDSDAANCLFEAIVEAKAGDALLESIDSPEGFLHCLGHDQFCVFLKSHPKHARRVRELAHQASRLPQKFSFNEAQRICELGGAEGSYFLRPGMLSSSYIDNMLGWLAVPTEEFFSAVVHSVIQDCMSFKPHDVGHEWLSSFLAEMIDYYGEAAKTWISQEVGRRGAEPSFWQVAIETVCRREPPDALSTAGWSKEQLAWLRRFRLERIRDEVRDLHHELRHVRGSGVVVIQSPLLLHPFTSEFPGHAFRPSWSWLMSEGAEAALYSWFREACSHLPDDYGSPEDSITGALCAYLKACSAQYRDLIDAAWQVGHPNQQLQLSLDYVDCRKGRDVGGADLVIVLSASADEIYSRCCFAAFQCKKLKTRLSFSDRELDQKEQLRSFTHSAYYMLYPCESNASPATGPVVVAARTVDGLLRARKTSTLQRDVLLGVGRGFEEYFLSDLLPGWSGDERWENPQTIREVVDAALRPVRILQATFTVVPREEEREGERPRTER